MKDSKNIFDLNDSSDLPDDMRIDRRNGKTNKVKELFKLKSQLTTREILVGAYRLYGLRIKAVSLGSLLCNLCRKDKSGNAFLIKVCRATYKKMGDL